MRKILGKLKVERNSNKISNKFPNLLHSLQIISI